MSIARLNNIVRLLTPARPRAKQDLRDDYARGLLAMGWTLHSYSTTFQEFDKGGLRIRVHSGDRVYILHDEGFKPMPAKARRNILLAGQWK